MKHIHNHSIFLTLALMVLVFVVAVYAYLYFVIGVSVTRAAIARNLITADAVSKTRRETFKQQYQTSVDKWTRLSGFFIPSTNVVRFIQAMESLGPDAQSTVTVSSIDADNFDGALPGTQGTAHAHVNASGSWASVMRTLELAEDLPFSVSINNVRLDAALTAPANTDSHGKVGRTTWSLSFDIRAGMIVPFATSSPAI